MLDVIQVDHHVVAHLQGKVQLFDFLASTRVRGFRGVQRCDVMSDRRAIDFHKGQAQTIGDVFHQCRFTVAGWRYQQQQSHQVGTFTFASDADLFRQVVTHHR